MYHKFIYLAGVLTLLLTSSCTHRLTDFTVISTKNVPVGQGVNTEFVKGNTRVTGKDLSHVVLFIPFGTPNMKDAIDRAIEATPGAIGLVDGVVKSNSWYALLYGQNAYIVEGTPLFASSDAVPGGNNANFNGTNQVQQSQQPYNQNNYRPASQNTSTLIFFHEVKQGETIGDIAKQYNVSAADIIKWNKLSDNNLVKGTKLTIQITE